MDKNWLLDHVEEAEIQLKEIYEKLKNKDDYSLIEFEIDIQHAIGHINTAYNTRKWNQEQLKEATKKHFDDIRKTPEDLYLLG